MKSFQKQAFIEMRGKIEKSLSKKPNHIETLFAFSKYYSAKNNITFYNLDSAYRYASIVNKRLAKADNSTKGKLLKLGISPALISSYKAEIAASVFSKVEKENTELAYLRFSNFYSQEALAKEAATRRDRIAYENALRAATVEAYQTFLQKYPDALQTSQIQNRLNALLYNSITKDKSTESYQRFILENPNSPFRETAELLLFKSAIKHHNIQQYETFVDRYPQSPFVLQALANIWFLSENKEALLANFPTKVGSVEFQKNISLQNENFLPFIEKQKFGFINQKGEIRCKAIYDSLPEDYMCLGLEDNFFIAFKDAKAGAFNKSGNQFIDYLYDEISYFSAGVFRVKKAEKYGLIHQTGFEMLPCQYQVLEPIKNEWVKFNRGKKYGVLSYYGDTLVAPIYEEIKEVPEKSVICMLNNKYRVIKLVNLLLSSESSDNTLFDNYEVTQSGNLIIKLGDTYNVMQANGGILFGTNYSVVKETNWGWVTKELSKYLIHDKNGRLISPLRFENVLSGRNGYGVKTNSKWGILNQAGDFVIQPLYDTLYFLSDVGILLEREGRKVGYFYKNELINYSEYSQIDIQTIKNRNSQASTAFIVTKNKKGKSGLMSFEGEVLLPNRYEKITVQPQSVIIVENRGKKGLVNWKGKLLTPILYDGIANYNQAFFSLLRNQKFGFFSLESNKIVNTEYDALVKKYGESELALIAKKGNFGLIDIDNNAITEFIFTKIHYWNDSTLLGEYNGKWRLYNFKQNLFLPEETFDTFSFVKNNADEIVIKTFKSTGYGLLSNKIGRIVAEEYTGIVNLGTIQKPTYFLEKTVAKSNLYITLYLNEKGEVIREQVLDAENYEKIICQE